MGILRELAREVLGPDKASRIWGRLEVIGDIAVIKSPRIAGWQDPLTLDEYRMLAQALLSKLKYVKSVWLAIAPTSEEYRIRRYVHLAGEERSTTLYKEYGCRFKVDILRSFITPRLSYEHYRVSQLVGEGEVVVNMFAGVGLFSILIACKSRARLIHSIDINPEAYKFMVENIRLNKVEDKVIPYLGDAARVIEERLQGVADRVLMPLPELALDYTPYALKALRGEGFIHFYLHVKALRGEDPIDKAYKLVEDRLKELGAKLKGWRGRVVRLVGPRLYQVVIDAYVEAY